MPSYNTWKFTNTPVENKSGDIVFVFWQPIPKGPQDAVWFFDGQTVVLTSPPTGSLYWAGGNFAGLKWPYIHEWGPQDSFVVLPSGSPTVPPIWKNVGASAGVNAPAFNTAAAAGAIDNDAQDAIAGFLASHPDYKRTVNP